MRSAVGIPAPSKVVGWINTCTASGTRWRLGGNWELHTNRVPGGAVVCSQHKKDENKPVCIYDNFQNRRPARAAEQQGNDELHEINQRHVVH